MTPVRTPRILVRLLATTVATLTLAVTLAVLLDSGAALAAVPSAAPAGASSAPAGPEVVGGTRATDVASVARALATDPLYVSTAPGTPSVEAGDVRGDLPPDVYVAVLPASAAQQVGGEPAALPGAVLGYLQQPGTVLVLVGGQLEGASRTQSFDRVQEVIDDARGRLASGAAPASVLVVAARGLTGAGQLSDPPSAARAGSPSGGGFLFVLLGIVVVALLSIPVLLRRARRRPAEPPARVLRDRVEVDAFGRVVRRVTARELAEESTRKRSDDPDRPAD